MIVPATAENIARAASALAAGELVAFPTETVYGLGANARDAAAIARLFTTKGRPAEHPVIVHLAGADALTRWAKTVPAGAKALVRDTVLKSMTPEEFYFRLSWLYGGSGLDVAARPHTVPKGNVYAA